MYTIVRWARRFFSPRGAGGRPTDPVVEMRDRQTERASRRSSVLIKPRKTGFALVAVRCEGRRERERSVCFSFLLCCLPLLGSH